MKKWIRIATAVLALLMLLSVGACSNGATPEGTTEEATEPAAPAKIVLNEAGKEYRVVRGEDASDEEVDLAVYVRNSIQNLTGFDIAITTDYIKDESEISPYEILVGNTNRPETEAANQENDTNGFVVAILNRKIIINAANLKALEEGCDYFLDEVLQNPDGMNDGFVATCGSDTLISFVSINGIPLNAYTLVVPSKNDYNQPIYTANRFFSKYCGYVLPVKTTSTDAHRIVIGAKKPDGSAYGQFEIGMYYKDGSLYLGCANPTSAQQVLWAFFGQYLGKAGEAVLTLPDDGAEFYHKDEADNWDDGNPSFLTIQDKIVRSCYKLESILQLDISRGKPFTYRGSDYKATIKIAREQNIRMTNCVIVGNWVLKDAGLYGANGESGIYNHTYDGSFGWTTSGQSKDFFAKYMVVNDVRSEHKSISQMIREDRVLPGDIIGFHDHNQTVLANGYAFDGGRSTSNMGDEARTDGRFIRWVGPNPYPSMEVGYIVRAKDAD